MKKAIRFHDLKQAGIATSWQRVRDLIEHHDFPPGFKPTPQTRLWWEDEVLAWVERHPVDPTEVNDTPALQKARAARAAQRAEGR